MTDPQEKPPGLLQAPPARGAPKGPASFCVPRAAIEALLDAKATAYEVCTYLTLAKYTDASGLYSPASISAVNKATGASKVKGGPVDRAIERLKTIRARRVERVSNGRSGKSHAMVEQATDLGPILFDRDTWHKQTGEILPDGPTERGLVRHVLPDFDEPLESRVWFGSNLVGGIGGFSQPLKALKNAGDVAARLLLSMYAAADMEMWGGVRPVGDGRGPWRWYKTLDKTPIKGGALLIRARRGDLVARIDKRIISDGNGEAYWSALDALQSVGLFYEVVMVLNRDPVESTFISGEKYDGIPAGAEPLHELDTRSAHGYKPKGEEGIGGAVAHTAGELNRPVTTQGQFDGTYAAIVPVGYPAMIAGIYRPRFRPANPKNAGVKGTWARIHQNNRDAFDLLLAVRAANGLKPLAPPWEMNKPAERIADEPLPF